MESNLYIVLPQLHKCGTEFKRRGVPVDSRVLNKSIYDVPYCSKCDVYVFNDVETKNPQHMGDWITALQSETNTKNHGCRFSTSFLETLKR